MHFVRVTGCNVGVFPSPSSTSIRPELLPVLRDTPRHSMCASFVGEQFVCDTEYNKVINRVSVTEIARDTWERHICFTGGEPMLFADQLSEIIPSLVEAGFQVNVETSGTLDIPEVISDMAWITCSPKYGFKEVNVRHIDELKFIVSVNTSAEEIKMMEDLSERVGEIRGGFTYIQPVNGVTGVIFSNIECCIELLKAHPEWRLSVQLHKLLGVE